MSWLMYVVDSDYRGELNNAEMELSNNGFKKIDLKCDDNYAIYYNDEIKALCSVEYYEGRTVCILDSALWTEQLCLPSMDLLPGVIFLIKRRSKSHKDIRLLHLEVLPIISKSENDKILNGPVEDLDTYIEKSFDEGNALLGMINFNTSILNSVKEKRNRIKLSRLEQMPTEIQELVAELNEKTDSADDNDKGIVYKLGSKK